MLSTAGIHASALLAQQKHDNVAASLKMFAISFAAFQFDALHRLFTFISTDLHSRHLFTSLLWTTTSVSLFIFRKEKLYVTASHCFYVRQCACERCQRVKPLLYVKQGKGPAFLGCPAIQNKRTLCWRPPKFQLRAGQMLQRVLLLQLPSLVVTSRCCGIFITTMN